MHGDLSTSGVPVLTRVTSLLAAGIDDYVDEFYRLLRGTAGQGAVLSLLDDEELTRLKRRQGEHLLALLDPDLDEQQAFERGRFVGRVHAMVGVDIASYAHAVSFHHHKIFDLVGSLPDPDQQRALYSTVAGRLMQDLQAALAGYRDLDAAEHRAMMRLVEVASSAGTVPDLVQGVLEACTMVDGIVAGMFGRPDHDDVFRFELGVGHGTAEFLAELTRQGATAITVTPSDASGQGPSGRAWRTTRIEASDSYLTDPTTAPWHRLARRLGWRSSVAVPVCGADGRPRALLSLYSSWPGFFAPEGRRAFLEHVRHLLEGSLAALEGRGTVASDVRDHSSRASYVAKVHAGEVEMVFQPVVELVTGRVARVESLGRLVAGDRLLPPSEFLPALGDEELVRLFEEGLAQSLEAIKEWSVLGVDVGVSLNLPSVSSRDDRYVPLVERALREHGVEPSRLTLELLETGYVDGRARWRSEVLDQFKALGVRLAQDDLGSGHSSLLRLRHFAFDDVKLDKSLIHGEPFDPRGALSFIQPLTSLAHSMGLSVVVEGLESDGLVEAAMMLGADAGQGYALSPPLRRGDVVPWIRGFGLSLDPEQPRTGLGALAGHAAWERRAATAASGPFAAPYPDTECPFDHYLQSVPDPDDGLRRAHAELHGVHRGGESSEHYQRWWRVMMNLLAGGGS